MLLTWPDLYLLVGCVIAALVCAGLIRQRQSKVFIVTVTLATAFLWVPIVAKTIWDMLNDDGGKKPDRRCDSLGRDA